MHTCQNLQRLDQEGIPILFCEMSFFNVVNQSEIET